MSYRGRPEAVINERGNLNLSKKFLSQVRLFCFQNRVLNGVILKIKVDSKDDKIILQLEFIEDCTIEKLNIYDGIFKLKWDRPVVYWKRFLSRCPFKDILLKKESFNFSLSRNGEYYVSILIRETV